MTSIIHRGKQVQSACGCAGITCIAAEAIYSWAGHIHLPGEAVPVPYIQEAAMSELTADMSGDWRFDPAHTRIGFSTRHAMVTKVRGAFNEFDGVIHADVENPSNSSVQLTIKVASIDTRSEQRDGHLRTNDFFDAPNYPEITFASTQIDQVDDRNFIVNGDLTIRGITKQISIPIEFVGVERDPGGQLRAGFEGTRRINRQDFGVKWNTAMDSGGVLVSDRIVLEFEVSAVKVENNSDDGG
jgi:polyisoprenoid-binding protein YceI